MFQFLFKYPIPVFTKGRLVLLGAWPAWLLLVLMVAAVGGLALLIRWKQRTATAELRTWRAWAIWGMQSVMVTLVVSVTTGDAKITPLVVSRPSGGAAARIFDEVTLTSPILMLFLGVLWTSYAQITDS